MAKELRIWIDVDNSPHVPFFLPLIREMERLDCEVTITARDCFQTCGLLDLAGKKYIKIGRHYGRNLFLKIIGLVIRALQLYRFGRRKDFSVAVGHGSRSLILAAFLLRIPMVNIFDYEFSKFGPLLNRLPAKQLVPDVIPDAALGDIKRVVKYPGLKEEVYVGEFRSDPSVLNELGIDPQKVIVTVRPPATEAHYHIADSEKLFMRVINHLMRQENVVAVVLPRNEKQTQFALELTDGDHSNIVIPQEVVNGLNLVWHSDLVISGGGTMNREAAALGIPVYSIFGGEIGAVDRFLAAKGRLKLIKKLEDVTKIQLEKSERPRKFDGKRRKDLIDFLVGEILEASQCALLGTHHIEELEAPRSDLKTGYVHIDCLTDKKAFLEFWKIPYSLSRSSDSKVSILTGRDLDVNQNNAIILLPGHGEPQLYHLDNGIYFFAKICKIKTYPPHLKTVATVFDKEERAVSFILEDPEKKVVYLPFSLDEVFENFYYEKHVSNKKTYLPQPLLNFYYLMKPFTSEVLRTKARAWLARMQRRKKFPRWPVDLSFEDFKRYILQLLLRVSKSGKIPFIWFWPEDKGFCLVLTHDVESGLEGNEGIFRIISIEQTHGFKSSFNVVPFKYRIDEGVMRGIKSYGCEIGVHGYSHDAKLFSSWRIFKKRIKGINKAAKDWDATGFRSASTYRNPNWFNLMEFDYDSSFFDTDPYEPQPGGCLSLFPYFIGNIVEMPLTMPQDYTLFVLLKEKDISTWLMKAEEIKKRSGLICLVAHPDEGYIGDKDKVKHYIEFLQSFDGDGGVWNPLPRELAEWWRKRHSAEIISDSGHPQIKNGLPEMCIKWAKLVDGELKLE